MNSKKFAVVDLETSGNNYKKDSIIQLSVVIIQEGEIVDQYTTFLSDKTDISPFIQDLTHISPQLLHDAPKFEDVAQTVYEFISDAVFVAHNVSFDYNFLKVAFNKVNINYEALYLLDTLDLTRIFFPTLESYQLGMIANELQISLQNAHRADEDARATAKLLIKIFDKIYHLDTSVLKTLYKQSKHLKYSTQDLLFSIISEHNYQDETLEDYNQLRIKRPTSSQCDLQPIEVKELYERVIELNHLSFDEHQLKLANDIFQTLESEKHLAIEAFTGMGKTMSYLIAALSYTSIYKTNVLISTSKKILQNEIIDNEFNRIIRALDYDSNIVSLKGKDNYVDLDTVSYLLENNENNIELTLLKMKLIVWLTETHTGDLSELSLKGPEYAYYQTAHIQTSHLKNHLYYELALQRVKNSHIIITNHYHLLNILPQLKDVNFVLLDEAHQLKNAYKEHTRKLINYQSLKFYISQIGTNQDERLLKDYYQSNRSSSYYFLENLVGKLNQNIDDIFADIKSNRIPTLTIQEGIYYIDMIEKHIFDTNNYIYLYNYLQKYKNTLSELYIHFSSNKISINRNKQTQNIKLTITNDLDLNKIFVDLKSLILLSGTLEVNNEFSHITNLFNHFKFETSIISKSDMFKNTKLFIPNDVQHVSESEFIENIVHYMSIYTTEAEDKLVVIFTNYDLMNKCMDYIQDLDLFGEYKILKQNASSNAQKLLNQFNILNKVILFGTSSFTEGINFDQNTKKVIILVKLPFPVPETDSYSSFYKHDLPEAVFTFRQILGRLSRFKNDNGVLVLLDKRILEKNYKNAFLKYFPSNNIIYSDYLAFKELLRHL